MTGPRQPLLRARFRPVLPALALLGCLASAPAQEAPAPQPQPDEPRLETGEIPDEPAGAFTELFSAVALDTQPTPLLPEGTFLSGREARLLATEGGDRVLALSPDRSDPVARAVIVLPSAELEKLERAAIESGTEQARFKVTGQVFAYHRYNYVLLSAWTQVVGGEAEVAEEGETEGDPVEPGPQSGDEVRDLIAELEESRNEPGAALSGERSPVWLQPRAGAEQGERALISDGTLIQSRRARLVRQGVAWTVAFDGGPESRRTDPLILLPCLHHERLERLTHAGGDEIEIEISGRVFAYRGRNYLLPTLFQVISGREITPTQ